MAEHDVVVAQRGAVIWQFFQPKDDRVSWCIHPSPLFRDCATNVAVSTDWDCALVAVFDGDLEPRIQQRFCACWCQSNPFFMGACFGPNPKVHPPSP